MIFNDNPEIDFLTILTHINAYADTVGVAELAIKQKSVRELCDKINDEQSFPCIHGRKKASIFKKAAFFISSFVEASPIDKDAFSESRLPSNLKDKDPNAIVAFDIAIRSICGAKVTREDSNYLIIGNPIEISMHSYIDIIDMLSNEIKVESHFMCISLLLEQITYKNNKHIEYSTIQFGFIDEEEKNEINHIGNSSIDNPDDEWNDLSFWADL